jgi:hypothetical protein
LSSEWSLRIALELWLYKALLITNSEVPRGTPLTSFGSFGGGGGFDDGFELSRSLWAGFYF